MSTRHTQADYAQLAAFWQENEARFQMVANLGPDLLWCNDSQGAALWLNQRWLDYTGQSLEAARGYGWLGVIHPDDCQQILSNLQQAAVADQPLQQECRIRSSDGTCRWFLVRLEPQWERGGGPHKPISGHRTGSPQTHRIVQWFGSATDIHDYKQAIAQQDPAQSPPVIGTEAEQVNRIKNELLGMLSHELRSPLNPILGWARLLQTHRLNATKSAEALAAIERNAKLQIQLIDNLLDLAKFLRGKLQLDTVPVDLITVIEAAIASAQTATLAKAIALQFTILDFGQPNRSAPAGKETTASPPVPLVLGDAARLQQVIWNLLSNAIKFTPVGGRVDIRLERVKQQAQITISDTGQGIKPSFLPYIFESFCQEDVSTTRKHGGLGLGLALVRQLVEAHGGRISVSSPGEGLGATFIVQLPLLSASPLPPPVDRSASPLNGIRVLTVDNDPDTCELLTTLLTQHGADVLTVSSAAEALASLETFQPDVLVSDIGMPDMDGYTFIRQVRTRPPDKGGRTPALALTAYAQTGYQQQALESGYQQYIAKPLETEQLVQAVATLANVPI